MAMRRKSTKTIKCRQDRVSVWGYISRQKNPSDLQQPLIVGFIHFSALLSTWSFPYSSMVYVTPRMVVRCPSSEKSVGRRSDAIHVIARQHALTTSIYIAVWETMIYKYRYAFPMAIVLQISYILKMYISITSRAAERHRNQRSAYQPRIHR
jgi:hypothetical protein